MQSSPTPDMRLMQEGCSEESGWAAFEVLTKILASVKSDFEFII